MNEDILNFVSKPIVIVIGIATSIIIFYLQKRLAKVFENREKKDRRHTWVNFLFKYDKNIQESILQFKQIEAPNNSYKPFLPLIGLMFGFFGFILLLFLMVKYAGGLYSIPVSITLYFLVIVFLMAIIERYKDKIKKSEKFLDRSEFVLNCITFINWFTFSGSFLSVPFIYLIYSSSNKIAESDLRDISFIFSMGLSFLVIVIVSTFVFRRDLLNYSKYLLNLKYLDEFPYIRIKTTTSLDFQGKLCDVFNENLIILDDNGVKKAAEWHSVSYLELGEERSDNTNLSDRI